MFRDDNLSATNRAATKLNLDPEPERHPIEKIRVDPCSSVSHSLRCLCASDRGFPPAKPKNPNVSIRSEIKNKGFQASDHTATKL